MPIRGLQDFVLFDAIVRVLRINVRVLCARRGGEVDEG